MANVWHFQLKLQDRSLLLFSCFTTLSPDFNWDISFEGPADRVNRPRVVALAGALLAERRVDDLAVGDVARHRRLEGVDRERISFGLGRSSLRRQRQFAASCRRSAVDQSTGQIFFTITYLNLLEWKKHLERAGPDPIENFQPGLARLDQTNKFKKSRGFFKPLWLVESGVV